jgi:dTDP-4-dehydrorhamnose 3,5-epimerase
MKVEPLAIAPVCLITPDRYGDSRGHFSEVFHAARYAEHGVGPFMQDNQSLSRAVGTIRGLHCQVSPSVQGKLVRCVRGALWDCAIDIREGSPTYGQHVAAVLSAENGAQLWVPGGFLHGFCTLEPDSEVLYKVTAGYDRAAERAVRWDDPTLALPWPLPPEGPQLSDKDAAAPGLEAAAGWYPPGFAG